MALQTCPTTGIAAFPLALSVPPPENGTTPSTARPTLDDYEARMEVITMDFQWGPLTTGITPSRTANYIMLQQGDTSTSVLYKSTRYTIDSVQIAMAQHSLWLIEDPGTNNKEDLIITLVSTDSKSSDSYIIIVVPIIRGGSDSGDPAYLRHIGSAGIINSYDLGSCLPPSRGPNTGNVIFAMYSTCINGYTGRANTQNVFVLVSTSGIKVTEALMSRITTGATLTDRIYVPFVFSEMTGGIGTSIDKTDFSKFITTTRYLTDVAAQELVEQRKDKAEQYKCMEIDPDAQVDTNGNMIIDVNKGEITNQNLQNILDERKVLKELVVPTDSETKRAVGKIVEYVCAMLLIILVAAVIWATIFMKGDTYYALSAFFICFCFFLATVLGLVGYKTGDDKMYIGTYVLLGIGVLGFIIWLPMWWFATQAAGATATAGATAAATATGATAVAGAGAGAEPAVTNSEWVASVITKIPVYGVIAVVSLLGGFVIGNFY
jgi:hypothetical protein